MQLNDKMKVEQINLVPVNKSLPGFAVSDSPILALIANHVARISGTADREA